MRLLQTAKDPLILAAAATVKTLHLAVHLPPLQRHGPSFSSCLEAPDICRICLILDITAFILFTSTSLSLCSTYVLDPSLSNFLDEIFRHISVAGNIDRNSAYYCVRERWFADRYFWNGSFDPRHVHATTQLHYVPVRWCLLSLFHLLRANDLLMPSNGTRLLKFALFASHV